MFDFVARWFRTPGIVSDDAADLMARFGSAAYFEARDRERLARKGHGTRPEGHWTRVAKEIARRTGRSVGVGTSTRYLEDGL